MTEYSAENTRIFRDSKMQYTTLEIILKKRSVVDGLYQKLKNPINISEIPQIDMEAENMYAVVRNFANLGELFLKENRIDDGGELSAVIASFNEVHRDVTELLASTIYSRAIPNECR